MQDNGYRIIKLKNGDNIITRLIEIRKKTLIVERPMQFKTIILVDQNTGNSTEMLVLKTWIDYSTDKILEIAADGILALSSPQEKLILCYEMEKEKEDNPTEESREKLNDVTDTFLNKISKPQIQTPPDNINVTFNVPQDMAEEIIEMMAEAKSWEDLDEDIEDEDLFPEVKPPKKSKKKKKQDASPKPPTQKKKKENKDFGNDWSDWSPDPKDYI